MMQIIRLPDWPGRLAALVDARLQQPFAWGSNDCCAFAGDAVLQITGTDVLAGLRGMWRTRKDAARVLRNLGGMRAAVSSVLGRSVDPAFARRGDVVLIDTGSHERLSRSILAVSLGGRCVAPTAKGLKTIPPDFVATAWRVG